MNTRERQDIFKVVERTIHPLTRISKFTLKKNIKGLLRNSTLEIVHATDFPQDTTVVKSYKTIKRKGGSLMNKKIKQLNAFTLAEVLITLGVIGVVAAVTFPSLISKYQEQVTVNHLLKTYSILSQAVQRMQSDYGTIDTWGLRNTETGQIDEETGKTIYDLSAQKIVAERLKQYLKVTKTCELGKICLNASSYTLSGQKIGDPAPVSASSAAPPEARFFLADGTYIMIGWYDTNLKKIDIMTNLTQYDKKKSIFGKNTFYFELQKKGLIPEGKTENAEGFNKCDPKLTNNTRAGRGCAAWVIYNKNMDYLHCREKLGWDKKRSCKE